MDLTVSTLALEAYLLVLARMGAFCAAAPLFGHKSVNARLRILIAACMSIIVYTSMLPELPEYNTVFGYAMLVIKEAAVGLALAYVMSLVMNALVVAGEFIDREIGFTMATAFDPASNTNVTITASLYDKLVYLVMLVTSMHHFFIRAIVKSFIQIPVGQVRLNYGNLYLAVMTSVADFFVIGFRIALPVFLSAMILNVILGVLSKSSPQLNMFAVGMQLKVFTGLFVLTLTILFVPNVTTYLVDKMEVFVTSLMGGL